MAIKEKIIDGKIFMVQTTYYIYDSEEHLQTNHAFLRTSDKKLFNKYKKQAKKYLNLKLLNIAIMEFKKYLKL